MKSLLVLVLLVLYVALSGCGDDCQSICSSSIGGCLNSCDVPESTPSGSPAPTLPAFSKDCNGYICAGECTPYIIDCCIDSFGDEVGSCPEDNPFCCEEFDL